MPENSIKSSIPTLRHRMSRPVLVGGLGLSAGLALWQGWEQGNVTAIDDGFTMIGLCALGAGAWLWRRRQMASILPIAATEPTDDHQSAVAAINRLGVAISRFQAELDWAIETANIDREADLATTQTPKQSSTLAQIQTAIAHSQTEHHALNQALDERQTLTIAAVGAPCVGKSTIIESLKVALNAEAKTEATAIDWEEIAIRATRTTQAAQPTSTIQPDQHTQDLTMSPPVAALSPELRRAVLADCVLYTIAGDLTASERRDLEQLDRAGQTTIVLWNKSDLVRETDRDRVLSSIRHQLADLIPADRIIALAAAPCGASQPNLETLILTVEHTAIAPVQTRIWQQIQRASTLAIAEINLHLNRLRRHRAEPIVRRYQWIAASATAANPIPSLDLLASGSIGTQLLIDLGQIYQRELSLDRARMGFEAIVEMLLKLGLVELSTQAIASLLKSHPVTFLAGSAAQGLSAAYLIHVIGTSAMIYFETQDRESFEVREQAEHETADRIESPWNRSRFQAILSQTIATTQRTAFLQSLLERATSYFASARDSSHSAPVNSPNPTSQA